MSWVFRIQIRARHEGDGPAFSNASSHLLTQQLSYSSMNQPQPPPPPESTSGRPGSKISPALLIVFVTVAAVFFASGLLLLLVRFLNRRRRSADSSAAGQQRQRRRSPASPSAIQRQLQQLFTLHDTGGLDQASIDALPSFLYTELIGTGLGGVPAADNEGPGEQLDCAVCLCEFTPSDRLRLIPACGHAFHLACIDAWLASSSTCPLCRGAAISLSDARGAPSDIEDDWRDLEEAVSAAGNDDDEKVVFPVWLGKFRSLRGGAAVKEEGRGDDVGRYEVQGEATASSGGSSRRIDDRRCYSMGSYQYVMQESALRLTFSTCGVDGGPRRTAQVVSGGAGVEGRRLCVVGKGESFCVSKIWQWSNKKGHYPFPAVPSNAAPLPWTSDSPPARRVVSETVSSQTERPADHK